jgi:hypothetical protein
MAEEAELERTAATLRRAVRLLQLIFDVRQDLLISESALKMLVSEFSRRLEREVLNRGGDQLLDKWEKRLPVIRTELVRMVTQRPAMFSDGKQAAVLSADKAARLLGLCPDLPEE